MRPYIRSIVLRNVVSTMGLRSPAYFKCSNGNSLDATARDGVREYTSKPLGPMEKELDLTRFVPIPVLQGLYLSAQGQDGVGLEYIATVLQTIIPISRQRVTRRQIEQALQQVLYVKRDGHIKYAPRGGKSVE